MTHTTVRVVPFGSVAPPREGFHSGSVALDAYFHSQLKQDVKRRVTSCFIAITPDQRVAGFYTLASASIPLNRLPEPVIRKLPRYPSVPAVRLGRLAVDQDFQGQGLGGALLADAIHRVARSDIASYALIVDAKDDIGVRFYLHHGFIAFGDAKNQLFLPLSTALNAGLL